MPRFWERFAAVLCYVGALRALVVALLLPGWAFAIPLTGLLLTGAIWLYARRRSAFLRHHAREGVRWCIQANLLLAGVALLSKGFYYGYRWTDLELFYGLWHFGATVARWAGGLISVITGFVMYKAARGGTGDALTLSH